VENVFHFHRSGGYDSGTLATLATAIDTSWQANMKPALPGDITLVDITCTNLSEVAGAQAILAVSTAGTLAQPGFESPGTTFALKFGTAKSGRSYRGRMYYPLISTTQANDGVLTSAQANFYLAAVENFFVDILADSGDQHTIVSYMNDCEWRTDGVATDVTSYSYTNLALDSQRRRLVGRGI
jgi:hypothetical protein